MKTIYLKVEVPDGRELIVMTRKGEGYQPITADFTEITLPKGAEIQYESYNFENFTSVLNPSYCFRRGANWVINKLKGE